MNKNKEKKAILSSYMPELRRIQLNNKLRGMQAYTEMKAGEFLAKIDKVKKELQDQDKKIGTEQKAELEARLKQFIDIFNSFLERSGLEIETIKKSVGVHTSILEMQEKILQEITGTKNSYDDSDVRQMIARLEEQFKKVPNDIFEFGSMLQVLNAGTFSGYSNMLNFKNGFTVVQNGQGFDISVSGGSTTAVNNEVVSFTGSTGSLAFTPTAGSVSLFRGGILQQLGVDYSISGKIITLLAYPAAGGEVFLANYTH